MPPRDSENQVTSFVGALRRMHSFFKTQGIDYCIIGGLAVQVRGRSRFTRDIDVTILTTLENEETFVSVILREFKARVEGAGEFAHKNKVLLVEIDSIPVDIGIGLTGFEHRAVQQASKEELAKDLFIPVCSAEDLVIHKTLANRDIDWMDIRSIKIRSGKKFDENYVIDTLRSFSEILAHDFVGTYLSKKS